MRNRPLRGWFRYGALPGMAVHLVAWLVFLGVNGDFSVMGQQDDTLTQLVLDNYFWTVAGALAASLGVALAVGGLVGLIGASAISSIRRTRPSRGTGWWIAGMTLVLHLGLWMDHIRTYPQVHAETLYNRGGLWASFQHWVTHGPPDWVFEVLPTLAFALVVGAGVKAVVQYPPCRRWIALGAILALVGMLIDTVRGGESGGTAERPNILIIANDSMRPDHLGAYGYARNTSPNIDQFASESTVFEEAYVPLARTFPSWASILTGRLPHEHGIRHMFPRRTERLDEAITLPRYLGEQGYRTAVVADYAGDVFRRMGAGFERIEAPNFNIPSLIWQRIIQIQPALLPYLDHRLGRGLFPDMVGLVNYPQTGATVDSLISEVERGDGRPFFIVGFFSSSHFPYAAADPWYRRYVDPTYEGSNLYQRFRAMAETEAALAADATHLTNLFDGTIAYFDAELGRLLGALEHSGRFDDTIIIITADHGEILYEFGTTGHGDHVRGRAAHKVPLIVHDPLTTPRRVPGLVRTVDLARTLALRTVGAAPESFLGADLGPMLRGETDDLGLLGYGETGLWFGTGGEAFYQHHRLPYPGLTGVAELEPDTDGEISMKPGWEDRVRVAKHRAVWDRTHKVTYMPTPDGPLIEGWRVEGHTEVPAEVRPDLLEKLWVFLKEAGDAELVNGFSLPTRPISEP